MTIIHSITQKRYLKQCSTVAEMEYRLGFADKDQCSFVSCLVEEMVLNKTLPTIRVSTCGCDQHWICVSMVCLCEDVILHVCVYSVREWERVAIETPASHVNNSVREFQMWYIKWHISYLPPPPPKWKINGRMPGRIPNERWINVISSFVYWDNLTALAHKRKYLSGFFSQDNIDLR